MTLTLGPTEDKPKGRGSWKKGQSGNPGGRPRGQISLASLCRAQTEAAVHTLILCMRDKRERLPAAIALLDRGWGKPTQHIETTGNSTLELHLIAARAVSQAMIEGAIEAESIEPALKAPDLNETPVE